MCPNARMGEGVQRWEGSIISLESDQIIKYQQSKLVSCWTQTTPPCRRKMRVEKGRETEGHTDAELAKEFVEHVVLGHLPPAHQPNLQRCPPEGLRGKYDVLRFPLYPPSQTRKSFLSVRGC